MTSSRSHSTIIDYKFCFVALNVFFTVFSMVMGQIKSLRNFSWIANLNIWLSEQYYISISATSKIADGQCRRCDHPPGHHRL